MSLLRNIIASSHTRAAPGPSDPLFGNVVLLAKFDGSNGSTTFPEYTGKTITAVGNAALSTGKALYGATSLYLDGTGDYVTVPAGSSWAFSTATDFCVEGWVWVDSSDTGGAIYCLQNRSHYLGFVGTTLYCGNGVINATTTGYTGFAGKWTHVAHTRASGIHRTIFDGVVKTTSAFTAQNFGSSVSNLLLGRDPVYGEAKIWYDSVRVTLGHARYTANFTPAAFPTH